MNNQEILTQISDEINQMAREDQRLIMELNNVEGWRNCAEKNAQKLKAIVDKIGWPTISKVGPEASHNAWLIVQHSNSDLQFQMKCLELLKEVVDDVQKKELAYLEDRVLKNKGLPQVYGTQVADNGEVYDLENPENVDQRRAEFGLKPLKEYLEDNRKLSKEINERSA